PVSLNRHNEKVLGKRMRPNETMATNDKYEVTQQAPICSGFGPQTTAREVLMGMNLQGTVAIVTGGYSGVRKRPVSRVLAPTSVSSAMCCSISVFPRWSVSCLGADVPHEMTLVILSVWVVLALLVLARWPECSKRWKYVSIAVLALPWWPDRPTG